VLYNLINDERLIASLNAFQVMALKNLDTALDNMRSLARIGLGPVLRYRTLRDGEFWSVIHCSLSPQQNTAQASVQSIARRSQWTPILATFP
jgi:hypothetical protein